MAKRHKQTDLQGLPSCAAEFIRLVIKKMRYRRKVREDVRAELASHFEDKLKGCASDEEREQKARQIIGGFGDVKLLAVLLRRAKKRCRPLWRKAVVRSFQAVGVVILYILMCFAPLLVGRPNISVNYVEWLKEQGRAGRPESQNAYQYYNKAIAAAVKMPEWLGRNGVEWPAYFNDIQMQQFSRWLKENNKALELLKEGTKKPHYWPVYKLTDTDRKRGLVDTLFIENLSEYRKLAHALNWRSRYKAYRGDIKSALDDCIYLGKFGRHQEGKGLLIEQLVGIAIEAMAYESLSMILEKVDVDADTLKSIQGQLQNEYIRAQSIFNLDGEKVFLYDYIQRTFTDDGKGGGRMLARGAPVAVGDWKTGLWRFVSLSYPDRRAVTAKVDKYFNLAQQSINETPWQVHQKGESGELKEVVKDSFFLKLLAPAPGKLRQVGWRTKTMRSAMLTVLALHRYQKENGRYPNNLCTLVELGYLKDMPNDPFSGAPLVYSKTEKDFILYSLGVNLQDDDGQVVRDQKGRVRRWADEGDWVFWPLAKSQIIR